MRVLRRIILYIVVPYLAVVVMLAFLQRSMMYFPDRAEAITPAEAMLRPGQVHTVTCRSDDGLDLHGWLVLADAVTRQGRSQSALPFGPESTPNESPARADDVTAADDAQCDQRLAAGRPCVLYFSGNAGNRAYRGEEFAVFTALGCDVLVFDYRGYGENDGSPTEEWLAADARAAWRYAIEQRRIAPQRMLLFGESLGGAVAVRLAAELSADGTPPAGLILRSSFSSMSDVGAYHYPWLPVRLVLVDRYPSRDRIGAVTCPILQLHGGRDTIVPIGLARELFAAAPERSAGGVAKRWVGWPGADHNDIVPVAEKDYRAALAEFIKAAVPTPAAND